MCEANESSVDHAGYRVAILEDDVLMAERLEAMFNSWDLTRTCHVLPSNAALARHISTYSVDVLLADIKLPDGNGHQSIRAVTQRFPNSTVLVISSQANGKTVAKALIAGAVGYLHKDDSSLQVRASVEAALAGKSPMSPSIASALVHYVQATNADKNAPGEVSEGARPRLTAREVEVIEAIARGLSYEEAAQMLGLSKNTLPVHVRNIYRKLQSNNRAEAVFEARSLGIID